MAKHGVFDIAEFKALDGDESQRGRFSALVSVFGNVDLGGDRVVKGAFSKSLDRWRAAGDPIPIIWSHNWGDPNAHIGYADPADVTETEVGLKVDGNIDLDNPFAAQVYRLLKERRVKEMSFGYDVHKEKVAKDGANELLELDLIEAGPTLKGINQDTQLLGVKADLERAAGMQEKQEDPEDAKAGRTLSKANEQKLRGAVDAINQVLSSLGEPEEEKSHPPEGGSEEPVEAEANGKASDDALLSLKTQIEKLRSGT